MSELMQERYGTPSPARRRLLIALTALLATGFLFMVGWSLLFHSSPAIDAEVTRYDVVDDRLVKVQIEVRIADDARGSCLVRATAEDHTPVGDLNLTETQLRDREGEWIELRTERRATTVELVRCDERDS